MKKLNLEGIMSVYFSLSRKDEELKQQLVEFSLVVEELGFGEFRGVTADGRRLEFSYSA